MTQKLTSDQRSTLALQDLHVREGDVAVVSSRILAERFGKQHPHVLDSIRRLRIPQDFAESNFRLCSYTDENGRQRPEVLITRDGAALLVMGWTGREAMAWKLAYIEAFNRMDKHIRTMEEERLPPVVRMAIRPEPSDWSRVWDDATTRAICRLYDIPVSGDRQPRGLASIYAKLYRAMLSEDVYKELKRRNPKPQKGSNHHQHLADRIKDEVRRAHMFTRYAADVCGKDVKMFWDMIDGYHGRHRQIAIFSDGRYAMESARV